MFGCILLLLPHKHCSRKHTVLFGLNQSSRRSIGTVALKAQQLFRTRDSRVFDLARQEEGFIPKPTTRGGPRGLRSGEGFSTRNRCLSRAVGQLGRVAWRGFSSVKLLEFVVKEMNSSCRQLLLPTAARFPRRQQETSVSLSLSSWLLCTVG